MLINFDYIYHVEQFTIFLDVSFMCSWYVIQKAKQQNHLLHAHYNYYCITCSGFTSPLIAANQSVNFSMRQKVMEECICSIAPSLNRTI